MTMGETDKKSANKLKGCILKLEHVPYGFFEKELFGYFSQFGHVVRVRVPRSKSVSGAGTDPTAVSV